MPSTVPMSDLHRHICSLFLLLQRIHLLLLPDRQQKVFPHRLQKHQRCHLLHQTHLSVPQSDVKSAAITGNPETIIAALKIAGAAILIKFPLRIPLNPPEYELINIFPNCPEN